uniref:Uncharacterized protein n=1 Tax=Opuntia streptacantha TaxID=393608 RepID=A0A7C8YGW0_OPUST
MILRLSLSLSLNLIWGWIRIIDPNRSRIILPLISQHILNLTLIIPRKQNPNLIHQIRALKNHLSRPHLNHPIQHRNTDHCLERKTGPLPSPITRRTLKPVRPGSPNGVGTQIGLTRQVFSTRKRLSHGDQEEPLGVGDLLVYGAVVGGRRRVAGDEGVELPEDPFPVLLLLRVKRGGFVSGLVFFPLVVAIPPTQKRLAGEINAELPEDGISPASNGRWNVDQGLKALLEGVRAKTRRRRRRHRWRSGEGEGGEIRGGRNKGVHHDHGGRSMIIVGPEIHHLKMEIVGSFKKS